MGVFCDHFRAADTGSVAGLMAQTGGDSPLTLHSGHTGGAEPQWLAETLESLAALARRALAGGERLYCWVSL
ncbi:MAG TPA: hypothetical protein VFC19_11380 [Candidatus Limnocylindrales bacterium]|nr:hypothetical protein [Candidatus Limnocylindrales bacterium]